jgi:hypothetical protein
MDNRFTNQYPITLAVLRQWARHPVAQKAIKARRKGFMLRISGCIVAILIILGGILTDDTTIAIIGGMFLALFLYRLFILPDLALKKQYEQTARALGGGEWMRICTFADRIIVEDGRNTQRYDYAELAKVTEDDEYFCLLTSADVALRVRKDSFTLGTCNDFRDFISIAVKNKALPL